MKIRDKWFWMERYFAYSWHDVTQWSWVGTYLLFSFLPVNNKRRDQFMCNPAYYAEVIPFKNNPGWNTKWNRSYLELIILILFL